MKIDSSDSPVKGVIKAFIWVNIYVQCLFPVSNAFASTFVASENRNARPETVSLTNVSTHPYTLLAGESIVSVAKQYNLSVAQLKKLNQFRLFSRPFEQLSAGDEIDVPDAPLNVSEKHKENQSVSSKSQNDEVERWLASNTSDLGSSLSGRNHSTLNNVAEARLRSSAVSGSQAAVSEWLNQFGTTKIQLGVADDLSLSESSLDMLLPLYNGNRALWFIQTGGRYVERRTTLNVGTGLRFFHGKWMYGANTFFDNDITGHNRRLGLGAELWTDYLRFSGNAYHGLTDWHQSHDVEDYDERPADGFDLSMSGWLPAYPQLGGKLKYEQYYGNEVALVSPDSRQHDPRAFTVGLDYTPVPLVTLGSEYRMSGGKKDMQVNLQFRWTPGVSLARQLSPDAVAAGRLLAGSRLELVERNNSIVLDYKKQEVIKLSLPETVLGTEGSTQTLNVSVTSKYGLDRIEWLLPGDFVTAGGVLNEPSKGVWQMTLPAWQAKGTNEYEISGVARDQKGNASRPVRMKVHVARRHIDASHSVLHLDSEQYFPADGKMTRKVILTARDENNAPVTGLVPLIHLKGVFNSASRQAVSGHAGRATAMLTRFAQTLEDVVLPSARAETRATKEWGGARISDFTESTPGVYEATLTSGTTPGELQLVLSVSETEIAPLKVTFGEEVYLLDNPRISSEAPFADGITVPEVRVTVTDKDKKPVINKMVTIYVGALPQTVTTDPKGDVTVKLPPQTEPGEHRFDIHSGDSHVAVNVTFLPAVAPYSDSALSTDVTGLLADGKEKATISLVLKNEGSKQPIPGQAVSFVATPAANIALSPVTDHGDGVYSVELRGTQPGHVLVSALVGNVSVPVSPVDITLEQRKLQIFKNGALLEDNPVVGDRLNVVVQCGGVSPGQACARTMIWHWEVEMVPGSGIWTRIPGAVSDEYVVTGDMQRRRLRVSE